MSKTEEFDLDNCQIVAEGPSSILIQIAAGVKAIWIPLSQISRVVRSSTPFTSKIRMTAWIAKQKGLR